MSRRNKKGGKGRFVDSYPEDESLNNYMSDHTANEGLHHESAETRARTLQSICEILMHHFMPETVEDHKITLMECIEKSIRHSKGAEQVWGARLAPLVLLQLGGDEKTSQTFNRFLLETVQGTSVSFDVRTKCCTARGLLNFLGSNGIGDLLNMMQFLESIFSLSNSRQDDKTPTSVSTKAGNLHAEAITAWGLLLTLIPSKDFVSLMTTGGQQHRFPSINKFMDLLESPHLNVRMATCETIALILECGRAHDKEFLQEFLEDLTDVVKQLAMDSYKYLSKRDSKVQRDTFRDVLHYLEGNTFPEISIRFGTERIWLESWVMHRQYSVLCSVMGPGMTSQLQENYFIRGIFQLSAKVDNLVDGNFKCKQKQLERHLLRAAGFEFKTKKAHAAVAAAAADGTTDFEASYPDWVYVPEIPSDRCIGTVAKDRSSFPNWTAEKSGPIGVSNQNLRSGPCHNRATARTTTTTTKSEHREMLRVLSNCNSTIEKTDRATFQRRNKNQHIISKNLPRRNKKEGKGRSVDANSENESVNENMSDDCSDGNTVNERLEEKFSQALDNTREKSAQTRARALQSICEILMHHFMPENVEDNKITLMDCIEKSIRRCKGAEQIWGARLAPLFLLQLDGDETISKPFNRFLLETIQDTSVLLDVRIKCCTALGLLNFLDSSDIGTLLNLMQFLESIFSFSYLRQDDKTPVLVSAEESTLHVEALSAWGLLLTVIPSGDFVSLMTTGGPQQRLPSIKNLMGLLESPHLDMRMAAGETIALILECGRDHDEDFLDEFLVDLIDVLKQLATDSHKHRSKRDLKTQRATFRDVLRYLEEDISPEIKKRFGTECLLLDSWAMHRQYSVLCSVTGSGMTSQLQENDLIRHIFQLDTKVDDAVNGNIKNTKKIKLERHLLNAASFKARSIARGKNRDKRSAVFT